jgi:hypothetical protein
MNEGKGLRIGPSDEQDVFLKFNFDYALYPAGGYFEKGYNALRPEGDYSKEGGYSIAKEIYAKSHLIVGEGVLFSMSLFSPWIPTTFFI